MDTPACPTQLRLDLCSALCLPGMLYRLALFHKPGQNAQLINPMGQTVLPRTAMTVWSSVNQATWPPGHLCGQGLLPGSGGQMCILNISVGKLLNGPSSLGPCGLSSLVSELISYSLFSGQTCDWMPFLPARGSRIWE